MGKNSKGRSRGKRRGRGGGGNLGGPFTVRMKNCGTISITLSAINVLTPAVGSNVLPLNPNTGAFGALMTSLASIFQEYRFKQLEIICHPGTTAYNVAYIPEVVSTPPTTIAQSATNPNSINVQPASVEMVPRSLYISQQSLIGDTAAKWWKSNATAAADDWDEIQGLINIVATGTAIINLEFKFHVQFTSAGAAQGTGIPRRSCVTNFDLPIVDAYFPDLPAESRYPKGRDLDLDFKRVARLNRQLYKTTAQTESQRLALLSGNE